jgi:hypothetical protein
LGATVRDDVLRKAIMPEELLDQCLSDLENQREGLNNMILKICPQPPEWW